MRCAMVLAVDASAVAMPSPLSSSPSLLVFLPAPPPCLTKLVTATPLLLRVENDDESELGNAHDEPLSRSAPEARESTKKTKMTKRAFE